MMFEFLNFIEAYEINPLPSRNRLLAERLRSNTPDAGLEIQFSPFQGVEAACSKADPIARISQSGGFDASGL